MGFLDKAKEVAGQAATKGKEMASEAAERAKEEARELQLKRAVGQAEQELGGVAFRLIEGGAVSHPDLTPAADRIRELRRQLAELERQ